MTGNNPIKSQYGHGAVLSGVGDYDASRFGASTAACAGWKSPGSD